MKTKLFFTGLALLALTTLANAQNKRADNNQQDPSGRSLAYVDANNNGICDNFENRPTTVPAGNRNVNCRCCVQGKQNRQGMGQGMGRGAGQGIGRGMGPGRRMAAAQGRPGIFVDENKNGVCDNYESAAKK